MPQYQGVWTLEQQAQAQSNQQWVTDPNFKNTTLLLQADGTGSGSQNQTFLDGSTNNFFITRNGNTTQGSFSPFSQAPGYWGNYFSGGYLRTTSSTALGFSTNPFTIEAWVYMVDRAAQYYMVGGSGVSLQVSIRTDGKIVLGNFAEITASTGTVPLNQWTHVAFVRSSTSTNGFAYYINGEQSGTTTLSTDLGTASATVEVATTNTGVGVTSWTGYISNVRVVKGTAVYTSAFTPSTIPLTAITNTSLLTCQSNRFVDNSSANAIFTTANSSVQAFSPFAPALQWTPDVVGGSGYFDGSGDYLSIADNAAFALGSSDFTIECWAYTQAWASQYNVLICQWNVGTAFIFRITASLVGLYVNIGGTQDKNVAVTNSLNTWNHFCVTRSSSTLTFYKNGVSIGTAAISGTISDPTDNITVGLLGDGNANTAHTGYISGLRLIKGTAVAPTITAPPTAVTNTSLLLNYTNAGIYDGKMANNLETVGNAQVATSPVKYGSGSMYFDGTGDSLIISDSKAVANLAAFRTGDFTVEMWVYPTANPGTYGAIPNAWSSSDGWGVHYMPSTAANPSTIRFDTFVSTNYAANYAVPLNQWTHIAVTRAGTALKFWVNGVQSGSTATVTENFNMTSATFNLGNSAAGSREFFGYIDDLRITKGVARYIANFTPPQQALPRQ